MSERVRAATAADAHRAETARTHAFVMRHGRTRATHEMASDLGTVAAVQSEIARLLPKVHERSGSAQQLLAGLAAARAPLRHAPSPTAADAEPEVTRAELADAESEVEHDGRQERVHAGLLLFLDDLEYLFTQGATGTDGLRRSFAAAVEHGLVHADVASPTHVQLWARELLLQRARSTLASMVDEYTSCARHVGMLAERRKRAAVLAMVRRLAPAHVAETFDDDTSAPELMATLQRCMQALLQRDVAEYNEAARHFRAFTDAHTGAAWRELSAWLLREPAFVHACYLQYCGLDVAARDAHEAWQRARIVAEHEFERRHRDDVVAPRAATVAVLLYMTVLRAESLRRVFMRQVYGDKLRLLLDECPDGVHSPRAVARQVRWLLVDLAATDREALCAHVRQESPFPPVAPAGVTE